jgi:hypothetical protein
MLSILDGQLVCTPVETSFGRIFTLDPVSVTQRPQGDSNGYATTGAAGDSASDRGLASDKYPPPLPGHPMLG